MLLPPPRVLLRAPRFVGTSVRFASSSSPPDSSPAVCVVGAGPAGFYVCQHLLSKGPPGLRVDLLERLPVPFGLVRFGVAPDHPEVKNVESTFARVVEKSGGRARFFGNVPVGGGGAGSVSVRRLREKYSAVVLAYGAEQDRRLGIPGEELENVVSARDFVNAYNGLPPSDASSAPRIPDLSRCGDCAAVVGAGNVALDVARVLLTPVDELRKTDITEEALEALSRSSIRRVDLVARRGPLHVAFTIKELREMVNLPGCVPVLDKGDFAPLREVVKTLKRPRKRLTELMVKTALDPPTEKQAALREGANKSWSLKLLRTPLEVLSDGDGRVSGLKMEVNRLVEEEISENQTVEGTGESVTSECGLVLRSIGYRSTCIEEGAVPFDPKKGVVPNVDGRVTTEANDDDAGGVGGKLYCAGWLATGPRGVIVDTMTESYRVAEALLEDVSSGAVGGSPSSFSADWLRDELGGGGGQVVDWEGWRRIDAEERARGEGRGKPREKITDVAEMLEVAGRKQ